MLGLVTNYSPEKHLIIPSDIARFCNDLIPDGDHRKGKMFLVRYLRQGTFVIAEWLGRERDVFADAMNLGFSLSNFDAKMADEFRRRILAPTSPEQMARDLADNESRLMHQLQDENDEEVEIQALKEKGRWYND